MLSWDEDTTPTLPASPQMPMAVVDALDRAAPSGSESAASPISTRRVNVADKRIINGQTDVNQLVPFKYKWA